MFTIVIFGSRHYKNQEDFDQACDRLLANKHPDIEIVEGDCQGPDQMAEAYAIKRGYAHTKFKPDWDGLGKRAGFVRNRAMADYVKERLPDAGGIAFYDGVSKGTGMMIELMKDRGLKVKVVPVPLPPPKPVRNTKHTIVLDPATNEPIATVRNEGSVDISSSLPMLGAKVPGESVLILSAPEGMANRIHMNPSIASDLDAILTKGKPRTRKPKPIIIEGETLTPDTKPKRKAPAKTGQVVYRHDYKAIYLAANEAWFKSEYPNAWKDGHMPAKKVPAVDTANGMASYIIDHAAWTGNFANRINVQGRQIGGFTRTQSGQVFDDRKFIKASTKKGTEDVDCIFNGVTVKLEIKIGSDRQSEDQKKHEARIKKAGGFYFLIKSIDDYLDIFLRFSVKQTGLFDNLAT